MGMFHHIRLLYPARSLVTYSAQESTENVSKRVLRRLQFVLNMSFPVSIYSLVVLQL